LRDCLCETNLINKPSRVGLVVKRFAFLNLRVFCRENAKLLLKMLRLQKSRVVLVPVQLPCSGNVAAEKVVRLFGLRPAVDRSAELGKPIEKA
jgi:hypothetical protein